MSTLITAELTAAGQTVTAPRRFDGYFNVSIWGTFSGSIAVQRSFDGSTWLTVDEFDAIGEDYGFEPEEALYRVRCTAMTSGLARVRIGTEDREFH